MQNSKLRLGSYEQSRGLIFLSKSYDHPEKITRQFDNVYLIMYRCTDLENVDSDKVSIVTKAVINYYY